ncbi:hypothetical protein IW152_000537 [Coemansia sp. BCRC 34962]|nr:hypothetical protein IW152_000537 [Coemansia sp. BCRC 34962]
MADERSAPGAAPQPPSRARQARYLSSSGPLRAAAEPLIEALKTPGMLPLRYDWQGQQHSRDYAGLSRELPHVGNNELLRLVESIVRQDSKALSTTVGTLLGRTHSVPVNRTAQALPSKLRQRCTRPMHQQLRGTGRLPLSVVAAFRRHVRCHGHKYATFCVLFDRTGRRMITGSDDYLIKIWCTKTGYLINTFKGHQEVITDMVLNVENTLLASASADGTTRIWNLQTGEPRAVLATNSVGRRKSVTAVRFSPSPSPEIRYLATTCDDGFCRIYRWDRDQLTFDTTPTIIDGRFDARDSITTFAFNHTGSRFAIATAAGYISVYSTLAETASANTNAITHWGVPRMLRRMAAHEESVTTLVFSSDGTMLLSGSRDGTAKVWKCGAADAIWDSVTVDLKEDAPMPGSAPETMILPQDGAMPLPIVIPSVSAYGTASAAAAGDEENMLGSLNVAGGQDEPPVSGTLAQATAITTVATDNGEDGMAVDDTDPPREAPVAGLAEMVSESTTVQPVPEIAAAAQAPPPVTKRVEANQVAWICDNSRVVVSNNLGTVLVFDPHTGNVCWRRRAHSVVDVYVLIPHPIDPRIAVSGGYDGRAVVWNVETGDVVKEIQIGEMLYDGAFSEDGLNFALSGKSGAVTLCGLGSSWPYKEAQQMVEQMFPNDYTAIISDDEHFVADEHTLIPSYLVPHGALRDFDGREHPHQMGPAFGMSINMGVDELLFAREDAGRRAALDVELDHAYIDYRAAQDPMAEVRPGRSNRRRRQRQEQPTTLGDDADELPEREASVPLFIPEDSDDEEYRAADDDDEEEEEEEAEEDDEEDEDAMSSGRVAHAPPVGHITRRTRRGREAGSTVYASDRDRRFALELLRTRHSRASARAQRLNNLRSVSQGGSDSEESELEDAGEPIDVEGNTDGENSARPSDGRGRGRLRRDTRASQQTSEPETSDGDFQPSTARTSPTTRAGGTRGRPRGRRAASSTARLADVGRQTRNRRIASDSEDEASGGDGGESADNDAEAGVSSGSEFEDSGTRGATSTRRRPGRASGNRASTRSSVSGGAAGDEAPQTRLQCARSGSSDDAHRNLTERESHSEDIARLMADASVEDMAQAGPSNRRVPRSSDNPPSSGDDYNEHDDEDGPMTRRQSKRSPLPPAETTRRSATKTTSSSLSHHSAAVAADMRAGTNGGELYRPTDWVLSNALSTVPYRPQVGDIVAYFREGHEDFWNSPVRCQKLDKRLLPSVTMPSLAVTAFGKVVGLQYSVGPPTYCTVRIQLLKNQTIEEHDEEGADGFELARQLIQVQYHDCDGVPDFLILYSRYRASLRRPLKVGDWVSVLFDEDQTHNAVITGFRDIRPTVRQSSVTRMIARNPWKSIEVEWCSGGEVGSDQVSPWELVHDEDVDTATIPPKVNMALSDIVGKLRDVKGFEWFIWNVDYDGEYSDYLLHVAYPMCLETIHERLFTGFYRHASAVAFDINLILVNARTYNDPDSIVVFEALRLATKYSERVREVLGGDGLIEGSGSVENGHYDQEMSQPEARRSTRRSSNVPNGQPAVTPVATRQTRKRKHEPELPATRQSLRAVRRRANNGSDESDLVDRDPEEDEGRRDAGRRGHPRRKSRAYDEDEDEDDDEYNENGDDDDNNDNDDDDDL